MRGTKQLIVLCVLSAMAVVGCGDDSGSGIDAGVRRDAEADVAPPPMIAPVLTAFAANPAAVTGGVPTMVQWTWSYAGLPTPDPVCTIDQGVGVVTKGQITTITVQTVTTYTLSCTNSSGTATRTVVVGTGGPIARNIGTFTATPMTVPTSTAANVTWAWTYVGIPNPTPTCSISPTVGTVTNGQTTSVTIPFATSYTLTCTNSGGSRSAFVTLSTSTPPVLATFTTTPANVPVGVATPVTFNFTYSNAPSPVPTCSIDQGIGAITTGSSRSITQTAAVTYTLTCMNAGGMATRQATIASP